MKEFVELHRLLAPAAAPSLETEGGAHPVARKVADFGRAMTDVRGELAKGDDALVFSEAGATALLDANTRFTRELAFEAIRLARHSRTDTVSKVHVDRAGEGLIGQKQSHSRMVQVTVGSLLAGAGLQEFFGFAFGAGSTPKPQVIAMIVCLVGGLVVLLRGLSSGSRR